MAMILGVTEPNVIFLSFNTNQKWKINTYPVIYLQEINACNTSQTPQHYPAKLNLIKPEACTI
jgi:hypothetical protein